MEAHPADHEFEGVVDRMGRALVGRSARAHGGADAGADAAGLILGDQIPHLVEGAGKSARHRGFAEIPRVARVGIDRNLSVGIRFFAQERVDAAGVVAMSMGVGDADDRLIRHFAQGREGLLGALDFAPRVEDEDALVSHDETDIADVVGDGRPDVFRKLDQTGRFVGLRVGGERRIDPRRRRFDGGRVDLRESEIGRQRRGGEERGGEEHGDDGRSEPAEARVCELPGGGLGAPGGRCF